MILKTMTHIRSRERKSSRDVIANAVKQSRKITHMDCFVPRNDVTQSRRDNTLLTVDAIYGRDGSCHVSTSPAGTILGTGSRVARTNKVPSLRDLPDTVTFIFRRINSTVNQVSSLRDCATLTQNLYKGSK